jgi:hypothetical protein
MFDKNIKHVANTAEVHSAQKDGIGGGFTVTENGNSPRQPTSNLQKTRVRSEDLDELVALI